MNTNKIPSIENAKESVDYNENESGEVELSFSTMPGRGFGRSTIKHSKLEKYIELLESINENPSILDTPSDDMIDIMKKTAKVKDGIVSWKTSNGRGSKPTRIMKKDLGELIKFIQDSKNQIEEYIEHNKDAV